METKTPYESAFQAFLSCTTEKSELASIVSSLVKRFNARSILDIGAGDGTMAQSVAATVDRYVAVERSPVFAKRLRGLGIHTIELRFPCPVDGTYDIVLASHVLPREEREYRSFLDAAEKLLAPEGHLVIITYDEIASEWGTFVRRSGLEWRGLGWNRNGALRERLMDRFGSSEQILKTSYVRSSDFDRFTDALAFVYSDGVPARIREFLGSDLVMCHAALYAVDVGYAFPFNHHIMVAGDLQAGWRS